MCCTSLLFGKNVDTRVSGRSQEPRDNTFNVRGCMSESHREGVGIYRESRRAHVSAFYVGR